MFAFQHVWVTADVQVVERAAARLPVTSRVHVKILALTLKHGRAPAYSCEPLPPLSRCPRSCDPGLSLFPV